MYTVGTIGIMGSMTNTEHPYYLTTTLVESKMAEMTRREMREKIQVGSRVRWKPVWNEPGLVGHEGTVVTLGYEGPGWAWVRYDDGTEKAAHLSELELI